MKNIRINTREVGKKESRKLCNHGQRKDENPPPSIPKFDGNPEATTVILLKMSAWQEKNKTQKVPGYDFVLYKHCASVIGPIVNKEA